MNAMLKLMYLAILMNTITSFYVFFLLWMVRCVNKYAHATCEKRRICMNPMKRTHKVTTTNGREKNQILLLFFGRFFLLFLFFFFAFRTGFPSFCFIAFHGFRVFCFIFCSSSTIPSNIFDHLQIANVYSLLFFESEKRLRVCMFFIFSHKQTNEQIPKI